MKSGSVRAFILGAGAMGLLVALALPVAMLTHREELPLERRFGAAAVSLVARMNAGDAKNPFGDGPRSIESGRAAYSGSCASCHGGNGDGRGVMGADTFPNAKDLTSADTKGKSDAELFWIIKNGLGFTAMPGFGRQYVDLDIWAMVSYLRALQEGRPEALDVPQAAGPQLAFADATGDAARRGAAHYFAQGCAGCHGPRGDAAGELGFVGRFETLSIRSGGRGMPKYGPDKLTDRELADLVAYVATFDPSVR